jgi:two-component system alkaline phosphatase synthesis response regulator PhoP
MKRKVLVVEDDRNMVELLEIHLRDLGCSIQKAFDGKEGLQLALRGGFDLLVLDLMLPEVDGIEICRRVRAREIATPILMLTAKSEEIDKVLGLEMGADDYMTKPFSIREFMARVKAIFRRVERLDRSGEHCRPATYLQYGDLAIDIDKRKVSIAGERIELSPKEFELLCLLASNPGKSYDRRSLLNLVWGYDFNGYEHTVNSHINRLRGKIEPDIQNPVYILTTWGVGYRFSEDL